jgi:hypothetical protein
LCCSFGVPLSRPSNTPPPNKHPLSNSKHPQPSQQQHNNNTRTTTTLQDTDDEDAEEFGAVYHRLMRRWARAGSLEAQKEYAAWLRRLRRARRAYADAYRNEDNEAMAAYGYEVGLFLVWFNLVVGGWLLVFGCWWGCFVCDSW